MTTPTPVTLAALAQFRKGSRNQRIATRLLEAGWHDKADLTGYSGGHINQVPYVVRKLESAGMLVARTQHPETGAVSYRIRDPGTPDDGGDAVATPSLGSGVGPRRIRFVNGSQWLQVAIPGLGLYWGRSTPSGEIVDLTRDPPPVA